MIIGAILVIATVGLKSIGWISVSWEIVVLFSITWTYIAYTDYESAHANSQNSSALVRVANLIDEKLDDVWNELNNKKNW